MKILQGILHYLQYAARERRYWLVMFLLLITGSIITILKACKLDYDFWGMYLAILGTFLTLWILIVSLREEWLRDLPKKLTVHFIDNETMVYKISAYDAPLLTKDDIRAWSQQIGRSICSQNLDLNYFEFVETSKTEYSKGNYYEHFEINYYIDAKALPRSYKVREYYYSRSKDGHVSYESKEDSFDLYDVKNAMRINEIEVLTEAEKNKEKK